ncbi:transposable element Tc1 transposase [Trichonephila clavipes]|nr:transposable element Tc1 transposase [Trichonephila clavipes]
MRPLEDDDKNVWTVTDFSFMIVAVELGPQQIGRRGWLTDSSLSTIRLFSDESLFQLCPDDHWRRVWRRPGQCVDAAFTIVYHVGPQLRVMDITRRQQSLPGNVHDLARQLKLICQEISLKTIRMLYHPMPCRVAACIQARGGSSPY